MNWVTLLGPNGMRLVCKVLGHLPRKRFKANEYGFWWTEIECDRCEDVLERSEDDVL